MAVFHQLSPHLKTGNESRREVDSWVGSIPGKPHHFVPYFLSGALDLGTNDLVK